MSNPNQPKGVADFRPPEHRGPGVSPTQATTAGARPQGELTPAPGQTFAHPHPQNAPYIDPGAQPAVAAYLEQQAQRAIARQASALPKYSAPVGGGAGPSIPRLNAPHSEGQTMSGQAENINSPPMQQQLAAAHASHGPGSIVEQPLLTPQMMPSGQRPQGNMSAADQARQLGLRPTDMLPPDAQQDPTFQRGNGSMFAVSQPHLVLKYGVVRNGQHVLPQQLQAEQQPMGARGQTAGLRPETVQGLADLQELQRKQSPQQVAAAEAAAEKQIEGTAAEHSASAGGLPKFTDEEKAEAQRKIALLDSFDFESVRNAMSQDLLNNPDQREIIESRLEPINIEDLIIKNRATQRVPIVPGRFEVTYTSLSGDDDLALKRLVMQESRSAEVTEQYLFDKYAFMAVTAGLTAINGNPAPTHLSPDGVFDEQLFVVKFKWVMQRPVSMLSSIGANHSWFEMRVRRCFVAEKVKNT